MAEKRKGEETSEESQPTKEGQQHNRYQERRGEGRKTETALTDILIIVLTGRAENELNDTFMISNTWGDDVMKKISLQILRKKKNCDCCNKNFPGGTEEQKRERVGWNIG